MTHSLFGDEPTPEPPPKPPTKRELRERAPEPQNRAPAPEPDALDKLTKLLGDLDMLADEEIDKRPDLFNPEVRRPMREWRKKHGKC